MGVLILAFLVLLLVLTGTFLSALGVVGWILLVILGCAIIYGTIVEPIQRRLAKAEQVRTMKQRANLGYGSSHELSESEQDEQQRRKNFGYGNGEF